MQDKSVGSLILTFLKPGALSQVMVVISEGGGVRGLRRKFEDEKQTRLCQAAAGSHHPIVISQSILICSQVLTKFYSDIAKKQQIGPVILINDTAEDMFSTNFQY